MEWHWLTTAYEPWEVDGPGIKPARPEPVSFREAGARALAEKRMREGPPVEVLPQEAPASYRWKCARCGDVVYRSKNIPPRGWWSRGEGPVFCSGHYYRDGLGIVDDSQGEG
jgi:hypothetical protein